MVYETHFLFQLIYNTAVIFWSLSLSYSILKKTKQDKTKQNSRLLDEWNEGVYTK